MKKLIILMLLLIVLLASCGDPEASDDTWFSDGDEETPSTIGSNTSDSSDDDTTDSSQTIDSSVDSTDSSAGITDSSDSSSSQKPEPPKDDDEERLFKVYLEFNGGPFIPEGEEIKVVWNDGLSFVEATVDENGIAEAKGLDGNYVVTIKNLPSGYTYDPNPYDPQSKEYGYVVTNDNPETTIEIFKLGSVQGAGSTQYNRVVITRTGVYRATLTGDEHKIFFEFAPKSSGKYTIESWLPVTDDKINPKVDVYTSSFAAPIFLYTIDAGGAEGKYYTKNFKYEVEIADEMISSGGQVVFVFAVHTTAKNDRYYPINVDFAVKYEGGFELERTSSNFMVPNELYGIMAQKLKQMKAMSFDAFSAEFGFDKETYDALQNLSTARLESGISLNAFLNEYNDLRGVALDYLNSYLSRFYKDTTGKVWKNPATEINGRKVLIGTNYKYNEETGFYHKFDEHLYASNPYGYGEGYGPVLYADITSKTRTGVLDETFVAVEYHGNKALTVSNGTENYKFFIESYASAQAMSTQILGGPIECPAEYENLLGYASIINGDGAAPVTRELMEFLQKYAVNQVMFMDGDGWAERADNAYESTEDDQWLFACGYYE